MTENWFLLPAQMLQDLMAQMQANTQGLAAAAQPFAIPSLDASQLRHWQR